MQPVETSPGLAEEGDSTAELGELELSAPVPVLNEFDGLVAVALRFDHVAVLASSAAAARTATVPASLTKIAARGLRLECPGPPPAAPEEDPGPLWAGSSSVLSVRLRLGIAGAPVGVVSEGSARR